MTFCIGKMGLRNKYTNIAQFETLEEVRAFRVEKALKDGGEPSSFGYDMEFGALVIYKEDEDGNQVVIK